MPGPRGDAAACGRFRSEATSQAPAGGCDDGAAGVSGTSCLNTIFIIFDTKFIIFNAKLMGFVLKMMVLVPFQAAHADRSVFNGRVLISYFEES